MNIIHCIKNCKFNIGGNTVIKFKKNENYDCIEYFNQVEVYDKQHIRSITFANPYFNTNLSNNFQYGKDNYMQFRQHFEERDINGDFWHGDEKN